MTKADASPTPGKVPHEAATAGLRPFAPPPAWGIQVIDPNANPTRRLAEARRRRQKLAAADLLSERFSRASTAAWWPTPEKHADVEVMEYFERLDAVPDDEEV